MARPLLQLDADQIADLAQRGASNRMIAHRLGCSPHTIARRFGTLLRKKRIERQLMILDAQWRMLLAGNSTMAVWLGRNYLGQSERPGAALRDPAEPSDEIRLVIVDGRSERVHSP